MTERERKKKRKFSLVSFKIKKPNVGRKFRVGEKNQLFDAGKN